MDPSPRRTVAVDIDGVLAVTPSVVGWAQTTRGRWGGGSGWAGQMLVPVEHAVLSGLMRRVVLPLGLLGRAPVAPGAVAALTAMATAHRLIAITSRGSRPGCQAEEQAQTRAWLDRLGVPFAAVHFTRDKAAVAFDVLIDDMPHHLLAAAAAGRRAVAFDRPYNRHLALERVLGWSRVPALLGASS